ncbi:hypothetical protein MJO28_011666 [Puccinia striiformis f. sp. tritici]|uniref:Uncharacterized protein n=1 Tax=Puccinia striiformis f. sp. tritici TaxID=168172 RepID=A0ACC0E5U1_9BASI|nr:hypothetical protein MJO28_011666 [Puccinia striiformis f. sp. tritici]
MEHRSLHGLPANQYTFGTLDTIEEALQTLDPGRQAALRALSNGMDSTFLVLHEDPHRPASPHEELLEIMRRDSPEIVDALQALTPSCRVAISTFINRLESAILRMNINPSRIVDTDPLGVDPNPSSDQQVSEVSENEDLMTPAIETPLPPYSRHDPLFQCSKGTIVWMNYDPASWHSRTSPWASSIKIVMLAWIDKPGRLGPSKIPYFDYPILSPCSVNAHSAIPT